MLYISTSSKMCHNPTTVAASPSSPPPKSLNPKADKFFPPQKEEKTYSPNNGGIKFPYQICYPKPQLSLLPGPAPGPAAEFMHGYPVPAPALYPYNQYHEYYLPHQHSTLETYKCYPPGYGPDLVPKPGYGRKMGQSGCKLVPSKIGGLNGGKGGFSDRKMSERFVPPRFRANNFRKWQNTIEEKRFGGKVCGLQWRPKKANSDEGWSGVVGLGPSSSPPTPLPCHSDDDGIKCKNTSVMIRNIPNQYSRNELLDFLDKYCKEHNMEYDFAYLPMDFKRHNNRGYAFVNFTMPNDASKFQGLLNGYKWGQFKLKKGCFKSNKICEITWAKIQGKEGLVGHFKNSNFPCYREEYLPVELNPPSNGSALVSTLTTVGTYWGSA